MIRIVKKQMILRAVLKNLTRLWRLHTVHIRAAIGHAAGISHGLGASPKRTVVGFGPAQYRVQAGTMQAAIPAALVVRAAIGRAAGRTAAVGKSPPIHKLGFGAAHCHIKAGAMHVIRHQRL